MYYIFNHLKTELLDYFNGEGATSSNGFSIAGATHSPFELKEVLFYNNQDNEPNQHKPVVMPMCYISFPNENEWLQLPMSLQLCHLEFRVIFMYESYKEMSDDTDIFKFWTEIVNKIEKIYTSSEEFIMSQPKRLRDLRVENETNIWRGEISFQTNITDKSMMKFKYQLIDNYNVDVTVIPPCWGKLIEAISGGDPSSGYGRLIGLLYDYTNEEDVSINNIKIGGGSPSDVGDIIIKGGSPSD